ncbi:methionine--tRNA ligase [Pseudobacteriovorax antillogorgiicola]|uniref:Methionine--tRNA ligase n=1 Tax=Pseudobacteriovorax antillogorgiicola TaxID=1513793 RepID=A0A1Y6CD09_9BACT|nr:methionine--tRNA ligase [Pseudobacteriovorax antillogorgiicola]TCS49440.1 methionyl-tRNA synthetase [Pseudobacteriovorax antillogorgiicola]SMF46595.1 methionyl-tRNA synthetase [Pseudobacteriovorax antillogorgiicola]
MTKKRNILITPALPYANGQIHLGHMLEHLMVDIWARYFKMQGHDCQLICADDTHGAPIMLSAQKQGITPEQLIDQARKDHLRDFEGFEVAYDNYSSTNTENNEALAASIFEALSKGNHLERKSLKQAYCEHDKMFLPDRFVKGTCPKCGAEEQYGDGCEVCGTVYSAHELKKPFCSLCGNQPVQKESEHLFIRLQDFKDFLKEWVPQHTGASIKNKLDEWLKDDQLQSWCISRDEPYFGFEIPGHPKKYYYVWFDAPVGYMASFKEWCDRNDRNFEEEWNREDREIYHVIGKDIVYHHSLFWPSMLKASGYRTPSKIMVHGMLNVNGTKMSKSRGTFIMVQTYLKHMEAAYMRYYLACKINSGVDDLDLNLQDFVSRVNSDLIGKITNVASRGASMLHKLDGTMGSLSTEGRELVEKALKIGETVAQHYEQADFSKAMIGIRDIADEANKYFDHYEPWKLIKTDQDKTKEVLTTILNLFRIMAIYLKPVLPSYTAKVEELFNEGPYTWENATEVLENHGIKPFKHLLKRIDPKQVEAIQNETKEFLGQQGQQAKKKTKSKAKASKNSDEIADTIDFDQFMKVDLRVAKIVDAKPVEGADKLLQLTLDIGKAGQKNVFAGIKSAYKPEDLVGRLTVMVANLAPRKMKFGMSEGMVLAAGDGKDIHILSPDSGAQPGQRIS